VRQEELRKNAQKLAKRAESLKKSLNLDSPIENKTKRGFSDPVREERNAHELSRIDALKRMAASTPKLVTALDIAQTAERYELEGQYKVLQLNISWK